MIDLAIPTVRRHIGTLLLAGSLLGAGGCVTVAPTDGALVCAPRPNSCPSGYGCASDNHCWRHPETIGGSGVDGGVDAATDAAMSIDGALPGGDLAMTTTDMRAAAPVDLARPPADMTLPLCPTGALFCDGFESGSIATKWPTTFISPSGAGQTLAVAGTQKHTGSFALHGAASFSSDSWSLAQYNWAGNTGPLYMRVFVRPTTALANHGMVARVMSHNDTHGYQIGGSAGGNWTISENLGTDHDSTTAVTTGAWTCLELVIPASGEVQLFVNGAATPAVHFTPATPGETYNELHVGVEWAPPSVPVDVWVDDVALATSALPCD